jgi:hypothetical protein
LEGNSLFFFLNKLYRTKPNKIFHRSEERACPTMSCRQNSERTRHPLLRVQEMVSITGISKSKSHIYLTSYMISASISRVATDIAWWVSFSRQDNAGVVLNHVNYQISMKDRQGFPQVINHHCITLNYLLKTESLTCVR